MPRGLFAILLPTLAAAAVSSPASAQSPSFNLVGLIPNGNNSEVTGLSADGRVACGISRAPTVQPGFTWTQDGGRFDFGLLPGMSNYTPANAISGDGGTVVGQAGSGQGYRWRGTGALELIAPQTGYASCDTHGVSGDGSIVVGRSWTQPGFVSQAFRWTQSGGTQGLGFTQPNGVFSTAFGISRDGTSIVGFSATAAGFSDAFVWRQSTGMVVLPQLPGTPFPDSSAFATNFDGSIVVGQSGDVSRATMWSGGVAIDLGVLPGWLRSRALSVSDDGSVVTGYLEAPSSAAAFVWTPVGGMQLLGDYLMLNGVGVPAGWSLFSCPAVSADGRTFAGAAGAPGLPPQGFVATIPAPGCMGAAGLTLGLLAATRRRRHSLL